MGENIRLWEFTALEDGSLENIHTMCFRISDKEDATKQTEWIDARLKIAELTAPIHDAGVVSMDERFGGWRRG